MPPASPELSRAAVERFVADRCVTGLGLSIPLSALYRHYLSWVVAGNSRTLSTPRHFSQALKAHGFLSKRNNQGVLYLGLAPFGEVEPVLRRAKRARVNQNNRHRIAPSLKRFIECECATGEGQGGEPLKIRTSVAYARYKAWILVNKDPEAAAKAARNKDKSLLAPELLTMRSFVGMMRELGFPKKRTRVYSEPGFERTQTSESVLLGLSLRPEPRSETIPA